MKLVFGLETGMLNGLDPDQDHLISLRFVGPDLSPNCLQRLSTNKRDWF